MSDIAHEVDGIVINDGKDVLELVSYIKETRQRANIALWSVVSIAVGVVLLFSTGCSLHSSMLEDGRMNIDYRVGLKGYSIVHGNMKIAKVDIEMESDSGLYLAEKGKAALDGTGGLISDTVKGVAGLFR